MTDFYFSGYITKSLVFNDNVYPNNDFTIALRRPFSNGRHVPAIGTEIRTTHDAEPTKINRIIINWDGTYELVTATEFFFRYRDRTGSLPDYDGTNDMSECLANLLHEGWHIVE